MTAWLFTQYQQKAEPPSIKAVNDGIAQYESAYHQLWSEPSAFKQAIKPVLAIALIASGLFAPVLTPNQITDQFESRWHYPWSEPPAYLRSIDSRRAIALAASGEFAPVQFEAIEPGPRLIEWWQPFAEPVRIKAALLAALQQWDALQVPVVPPSSNLTQWFNNLSEPVRTRPLLPAPDQPFFYFEPEPPEAMEIPWFNWLTEPVRLPIGLKVWLQHYWEGPNRLLPPVNVTATLDATETNADAALFGIYVYNAVTSTTAGTSANVSITEIPVENSAVASLRES